MSDLSYFFEPNSMAIIGATGDKNKLGWNIVENFLSQFEGKTFFVNPKGGEIEGHKVYTSLEEIPDPVDCAIVAIPAKFVPTVVSDAIKKGVKGLIIESGGFAEVSEEGKQIQEMIVQRARANNLRIIGPNCIGVLSPAKGVDSIFIPRLRVARPGAGSIAMMTQSGAIGSAVLDAFTIEGDGRWISRFASYGNASDVDESDFLEYFGSDEKTKIILCHLEGFKNGSKFLEIARKTARTKPIVVLKTGRTKLGAKASESHTSSLAVDDKVVNDLLRQHGLLRVDRFDEMIQIAKVLAKQPIPRGNRVGIVTDGGGFAVMASDAVDVNDLALGELSESTIKSLKNKYPSYYISSNPLDLTGTVTAEELIHGIRQFLQDENIDSLVLIIVPSAPQLDVKHFTELFTDFIINEKNVNKKMKNKPIFSISLGGEESLIVNSKMEKLDIPTFDSVEDAMKILKFLVCYHEFLVREGIH